MDVENILNENNDVEFYGFLIMGVIFIGIILII